MTETQLKKRIELWQKRLAPTLGIGHWRVREVNIVDQAPGGEDASASVQTSKYYDDAWFHFTTAFVTDAPTKQLDEIIIHEWLHVAFDSLDTVHGQAEQWMPGPTHDQFDDQLNREVERLIEQLARTIYRLYVVQS